MKPHLPFVTLALLTAACGAHETAPSAVDPTKPQVAAPAAPKAKPPEFVAVITSRKSQLISAPFEGTIMKLQAYNGKEVREGDVVAELDDTKLKHDLEQARGQLEQAKGVAAKAGAMVANAKRRAQTERRLINSGAAAPEAFRNIQAEASSYGAEGASASGQIKSAKAQIADLEGQLAKAKVAVPFNGVLSVIKVKEGQVLRRGEPIARVFDPQELVIAFAVPATYKKTVNIGSPVEFVSDDGKLVPATIRSSMDEHDPTIEFTTFEAVIDPTYRPDEIRVGDNGYVRIAGAVR